MSSVERESLLRRVLTINGIITGVTGLIVLVFAGTVDEVIGSDAPIVVRVIGGGLVLFAAAVYAIGRADSARLRSGARQIMIADTLWVVASVAAVLAGWFNTVGNVLVLAVAAVVGVLRNSERIVRRFLGPHDDGFDDDPTNDVGDRQPSVGSLLFRLILRITQRRDVVVVARERMGTEEAPRPVAGSLKPTELSLPRPVALRPARIDLCGDEPFAAHGRGIACVLADLGDGDAVVVEIAAIAVIPVDGVTVHKFPASGPFLEGVRHIFRSPSHRVGQILAEK